MRRTEPYSNTLKRFTVDNSYIYRHLIFELSERNALRTCVLNPLSDIVVGLSACSVGELKSINCVLAITNTRNEYRCHLCECKGKKELSNQSTMYLSYWAIFIDVPFYFLKLFNSKCYARSSQTFVQCKIKFRGSLQKKVIVLYKVVSSKSPCEVTFWQRPFFFFCSSLYNLKESILKEKKFLQ